MKIRTTFLFILFIKGKVLSGDFNICWSIKSASPLPWSKHGKTSAIILRQTIVNGSEVLQQVYIQYCKQR